MTALATETAAPEAGLEIRNPGHRLFEPSGSTLEDSILGAWEDLVVNGRTACPVCAGELEPGGCASCGSELS